jgi:hypothetical protein
MTTLRIDRMTQLLLVAVLLLAAAPRAGAQEPPPRIPYFVLDLHGTLPRFPSSDATLAESRGMQIAELPGVGLGLQAGLHFYLIRWRALTVGIGGEVSGNRARQQPPPENAALHGAEEKFLHAAPQLSFNFGTGHGWSYISGGIGVSQWSLIPDNREEPLPGDTERLKTVNYGGGARWFAKTHLAFSFDVRFYDISPGTPYLGNPGSPRTRLFIIGAGVSFK